LGLNMFLSCMVHNIVGQFDGALIFTLDNH